MLQRLGLERHLKKTTRVEVYDGKQGIDLLGCHLPERLSGNQPERSGQRLYVDFDHRLPGEKE